MTKVFVEQPLALPRSAKHSNWFADVTKTGYHAIHAHEDT